MRFAVLKDNIVVNVAIWDKETEWKHDGDEIIDVTDLHVGIGDVWDGSNFSTPESAKHEKTEIDNLKEDVELLKADVATLKGS